MLLRRALCLALFGVPVAVVADTRVVRVYDADRAQVVQAGIASPGEIEGYGSYLWLEVPATSLSGLARSDLRWQFDADARHIHLGDQRVDPPAPTRAQARPDAPPAQTTLASSRP